MYVYMDPSDTENKFSIKFKLFTPVCTCACVHMCEHTVHILLCASYHYSQAI